MRASLAFHLAAPLLTAVTFAAQSEDARLERPARTTDAPVRFDPPETLAEWEARAAELRLRVRVAAGIHPAPPRAVTLETHGRIDRGDYTVERAWFESHAGHFVTGSLYRPKGGPQRKPGVLCPHGHWTDGRQMGRGDDEARALIEHGDERSLAAAKFPLQARCVELARLGCVVLHYDMIGYGDARQFSHDASFASAEDALRLQSLFGFQTWNSLCALDALCSLPDVDPDRIGVTGASGGGTQTFVLAAIDERVRVALPAVMVSEHFQGGCRCENGPHLRVDAGNVELAALTAPRALALTGADDWTVHLETEVLPPLRQLYALYGAEELVSGRCWPEFEHNYNVHARELMYEWFSEHLGLRTETPIVELDFEPLTPAALSVFDAEHPKLPERALPAAEIQGRFASACDKALEELLEGDPEAHARALRDALGVITSTGLPSPGTIEWTPAATSWPRGRNGPDAVQLERGFLARSGSGEALPALIATPSSAPDGPLVVLVTDGGIDSLLASWLDEIQSPPPLADLERLLGAGATVVMIDPLLVGAHGGELEALPVDAGRHASYHGFTHAYNRTLVAERVHDVLTAVGYARDLRPGSSVRLIGAGRGGYWATLASALAGEAIERTAVERRHVVASFDDHDFLPGALRYGGFEGFASAVAPRELWVVGGLTDEAGLLAQAYSAHASEERLHSIPIESAALTLDRLAARD